METKAQLVEKGKAFSDKRGEQSAAGSKRCETFSTVKGSPIKGAAFVLLDGATRIFAGWKAGF